MIATSERLSPEARRLGGWLFVSALIVYLFTAGGSLTTTDAVVTFDVTRNLVEHGRVSTTTDLLGRESYRGRDGRYYAPFGIGQSIYNVPFFATAKLMTTVTHLRVGKSDSIAKGVTALGQTFLAAAIVWQTYRLALAVTTEIGPAAWAALTLAFGSLLWPYARFGFNQPLACFTLLSATRHAFLATRDRPRLHGAAAGAWLAASLLTRHEMAIAALPIALWLVFARDPIARGRQQRIIGFASTFGIGVAIWLVFNYVRFGNPIDTGYLHDPTPAPTLAIGSGILALLFSPSASLLLYSPFAVFGAVGLFALLRRDRESALFLLAVTVTFICVYGALGNWLGGRSYGSRYLVVILPLLTIGWAALLQRVAGRRRRMIAIVVLATGVVVQIPGVMVDYAKVSQANASANGAFTTEQRQWEWRASPIVLNTNALQDAIASNVAYLAGRRAPPSVASSSNVDDREFSQRFAFSLDFWWLYLFYLGVLPRAVMFGVVIAFLIAIAFAVVKLSRSMSAVN